MTSGMAVLVFGAWSVLKLVLYLLQLLEILDLTLDVDEVALAVRNFLFLVFGLVALVFLVDLLMRIFVARSARAEALDRKSGKGYLVVCAILIAVSVVSLVFDIGYYTEMGMEWLEGTVSIAVSVCSLYALLELFVSGIRVKRLKKELAAEEKEAPNAA